MVLLSSTGTSIKLNQNTINALCIILTNQSREEDINAFESLALLVNSHVEDEDLKFNLSHFIDSLKHLSYAI